jgi:hypothetical protein
MSETGFEINARAAGMSEREIQGMAAGIAVGALLFCMTPETLPVYFEWANRQGVIAETPEELLRVMKGAEKILFRMYQ